MRNTSKMVLFVTLLFAIPLALHIVQTILFAYSTTGSFYGYPAYVPMAPVWARFSLIGFVIMMLVDSVYLLLID